MPKSVTELCVRAYARNLRRVSNSHARLCLECGFNWFSVRCSLRFSPFPSTRSFRFESRYLLWQSFLVNTAGSRAPHQYYARHILAVFAFLNITTSARINIDLRHRGLMISNFIQFNGMGTFFLTALYSLKIWRHHMKKTLFHRWLISSLNYRDSLQYRSVATQATTFVHQRKLAYC